MGLAYADQARAVAEAELSKVRIAQVSSSLATGAEGVVEVTLENYTGYPMSVGLELSGEGVEFLSGEHIHLDLSPGSTEFSLRLASEGGSHNIVVSLVAGSTVLDEHTHLVRFLGLMTVLPWVIVGAVLIVAGGIYVILRRRARSRGATGGE